MQGKSAKNVRVIIKTKDVETIPVEVGDQIGDTLGGGGESP